MLLHDGKWRLPSAMVTGSELRNPTPALQQVLAQTIGPVDVHLLRFLQLEKDEHIWQCQNDDEGFRPPANGRWIAHDELARLDLDDPAIRPLLETWFAEFGQAPRPGRAPWECQGWWLAAMQWIRQQLPANAWPAVDRSNGGKVCSPWSYAVRIVANGRKLFFKAARDWNGHETRLTCALARLFPAHLPRVIAVDHARGWLLMEDFGGHLRQHGEPPEVLAEAYGQYAQLQVNSTQHVSTIVEGGCPDLRGLEGEELEALFDSARRAIEHGQSPAVTVSRERIPAALAAARELIARMQDLGIPHGIVHGDFAWINIGRKRPCGHYVFFDWGSSCIWHPLVDLDKLTDLAEQPGDPFVQACLEPWTALARMERLLKGVGMAKNLSRLHSIWEHTRIHSYAEDWLADRISGWLAKTVIDLTDGQSHRM